MAKLREECCFLHLFTRDLLRAERQKGSPPANEIETYMKEGRLVPSEMLFKLIQKVHLIKFY